MLEKTIVLKDFEAVKKFVDIANEKGYYVREHVMKKNVVFRYIVYFVGIFATLIFGIYGAEFTTSSFIYGGF